MAKANTDTFTKHWDPKHGFTQKEAEEKKAKVDDSYGVNNPNAKWNPARIVSDPDKIDGFMVTITQKVK